MKRTQQTPQQLAYQFLRDSIVSGRFPRGTRLKSEAIAETLDISRMPVREAFRQLDSEGLIVLRPNRGATVTNLTPNDVLELFEMRGALEGLAAYHAATNASKAARADLVHDLELMSRLKRNRMAWLDAHDVFHDKVCELSKRQRLCDQIKLLRQQVRPYIRLYAADHPELEVIGHEHEAILDSLDQSSKTAEKVMRAHVMANGLSIVKALRAIMPDASSSSTERRSRKQIAFAATSPDDDDD